MNYAAIILLLNHLGLFGKRVTIRVTLITELKLFDVFFR